MLPLTTSRNSFAEQVIKSHLKSQHVHQNATHSLQVLRVLTAVSCLLYATQIAPELMRAGDFRQGSQGCSVHCLTVKRRLVIDHRCVPWEREVANIISTGSQKGAVRSPGFPARSCSVLLCVLRLAEASRPLSGGRELHCCRHCGLRRAPLCDKFANSAPWMFESLLLDLLSIGPVQDFMQ